ncbi:DeoR/GlpR transcriptional regulator [Oscillospiraceae bacterium HV4-5-C5C]|nr:DeoR/GlpR transcriptional regulator [Oscillospiraceae bacterium HV4-5-C5C]
MLAIERQKQISILLQTQKRVLVSELSRQFKVSEETIRRDLDKLAAQGVAVKSYGGAVYNENASIELPFNVRKKRNVAGKELIAGLAADLVQDDSHIFLDASTTAVFIAKAIRDRQHLTVITNSLEIMIELGEQTGWTVLSSGGRLKPGYLALVGPQAVGELNAYNAEQAFLSCKGLSAERGVTEGNEELAQTKQAILASARSKILTVDHSKFDQVAFARVCEVGQLDTVITDERPSDAWLERLAAEGVNCIYPGQTA